VNSTLQLGSLDSLSGFLRSLLLLKPSTCKPSNLSTILQLPSCTVSVHSKPFRINTCKAGSKQTILTVFRINTSWGRPHSAQFWCNVTPFRINTCKSVSKQMTLSPFRINTYEKTGGWGSPLPRATAHSFSSLLPYILASLLLLAAAFSYLIKAPCAAA